MPACGDSVGQRVQDQEVGPGDVAAFALESGNPDNIRGVETLELDVELPERLHGFVFVDTPTSSALGSGLSAVCLGFPVSVGVVLHVVRGSVPLEEEELVFLEQIDARDIPIVAVVTRIDLETGWQASAELVARQLHDRGIAAPVLGVSSALRRLALGGATTLDEESGVPRLLDALERAGRAHRTERALATVIPDTLDRVRDALERRTDVVRVAANDGVDDPLGRDAPWRTSLAARLDEVATACAHDVSDHVAAVRQRLDEVAAAVASLADWDRLAARPNGRSSPPRS